MGSLCDMKCPYCGTENRDTSKKCKKCKFSLDPLYTGVPVKRKPFRQILPVIVLLLILAAFFAVGIIRSAMRFHAFGR